MRNVCSRTSNRFRDAEEGHSDDKGAPVVADGDSDAAASSSSGPLPQGHMARAAGPRHLPASPCRLSPSTARNNSINVSPTLLSTDGFYGGTVEIRKFEFLGAGDKDLSGKVRRGIRLFGGKFSIIAMARLFTIGNMIVTPLGRIVYNKM